MNNYHSYLCRWNPCCVSDHSEEAAGAGQGVPEVAAAAAGRGGTRQVRGHRAHRAGLCWLVAQPPSAATCSWRDPTLELLLAEVLNHEQPLSVWLKSVLGNKRQCWSCGCLCKAAQLPALLHWADGKSFPCQFLALLTRKYFFPFFRGKKTPKSKQSYLFLCFNSQLYRVRTAAVTEVPLIQHSLPPKHKLTRI